MIDVSWWAVWRSGLAIRPVWTPGIDGALAPETLVTETWLHPVPVGAPGTFAPPGVGDPATRLDGSAPVTATDTLENATFLSLNQDPEGDMPRDVAYSADGTEA